MTVVWHCERVSAEVLVSILREWRDSGEAAKRKANPHSGFALIIENIEAYVTSKKLLQKICNP
tara:strand:- start:11 stop:199 length:189 start_codon:yes stop_codon:yes gene_type:complete